MPRDCESRAYAYLYAFDVRFQRISDPASEGHARVRVPSTEEQVEYQQSQAKIVVVGCSRETSNDESP
jgi:hypothetical protein